MAVRSQDEIQNEWKRVARGLFNQLAQNSADEQAIKKVNLERKAVRQILLSLLIKSGQEKFLDLIFNVIKEDPIPHIRRDITCQVFYYFASEPLQKYVFPVISKVAELEPGTDEEGVKDNDYPNNRDLFWYGGVFLQSEVLNSVYTNLMRAFRQDAESEGLTIDDIRCAKVLGLDDEIAALKELASKLILSKRQEDRVVGLYLTAADDTADKREVINSMLNDRASFVKESAEELLSLIEQEYSIRTWFAKVLWETHIAPSPIYKYVTDDGGIVIDVEFGEDGEGDKPVIQFPFPEDMIAWLTNQPVNRTTELVAVRESIEPAETTTDLGIVELIRPDDVSCGRLEEAIEVLPHLLMQSKLVMLGIKQGLDVTVARDNRSKKAGNVDFTKNTIAILPHLGGITEREMTIIDYIDVLWLNKRHIVRAIEIEYSTAIYSGLLRLSDLILSIPNLRILISIVLPQERVAKLQREIARPTFAHLKDAQLTYCTFEDIDNIYDEFSAEFWARPTKAEFLIPWKTIE
jgi:hypothetical protein